MYFMGECQMEQVIHLLLLNQIYSPYLIFFTRLKIKYIKIIGNSKFGSTTTNVWLRALMEFSRKEIHFLLIDRIGHIDFDCLG